MKTLCLFLHANCKVQIAGGVLDSSMYDSTSPPSLDIRTLLPEGFVFRDMDQPASIKVAPISQNIERQLNHQTDKKSDIANLFTKEHLTFLHARLLTKSENTRYEKGNIQHPVWKSLLDSISTNGLPISPAGLSRTISEHLGILSTNILNMWSGTIYSKSLDYLLRILLRLHLAKNREESYKKRCNTYASNPRNISKKGMTASSWKRRLKSLCNTLAGEIEVNRVKGIQSTLKGLCLLQEYKPTSASGNISDTANDQSVSEETLEDMLDQMIEKNPDIDLDDISWDEYGDEATAPDVETLGSSSMSVDEHDKDSPAQRLVALQVVLKTLLESPSIKHRISAEYVEGMAHHGKKFTRKESKTVADLANILRPYVPKRRFGKRGKTKEPINNVALRAPVVLIANAVLRATGYHNFTRSIAPEVSPSSTHALHMGAVAIYEIFASSQNKLFDIMDANGAPLTAIAKVTKPQENKEAVIGAFFDIGKVKSICSRHGLEFVNRYINFHFISFLLTV